MHTFYDAHLLMSCYCSQTNYKAYLKHIAVLRILITHPQIIERTGKSQASYLTETRQSLLELAASPKFSKIERAPLIALLAINKMLDESPELEIKDYERQPAAETVQVLSRYIEEFGHKGCVYNDVKDIVAPSHGEIRPEIKSLLETMTSEQTKGNFKAYNRKLNGHKLLRYALPPGDLEMELAAGDQYLGLYLQGAEFGESLPVTDIRPADDYGLMAAQAWTRASSLCKGDPSASRTYMLMAIHVLETMLKDSPASGQARMLLIRLLRLIGKL